MKLMPNRREEKKGTKRSGKVMKSTTWVGVASIVILGAFSAAISATAGEKEAKTTIDKVPAAVKAAIEKATTGGKIEEIEKKRCDTKVVYYEVDYVKDGEEKAIQVTQDGTIIKTEEKTTIDKVPAVVKAAIEKTTAGGEVKEIEKEQYDGKVVYDVDYVKDGQKKEIEVAEDGAIVTSTKKEDDDKAEDNDKDNAKEDDCK